MAANAFLQLVTDSAGDLGGTSRLYADVLSGSVRRGTTNIEDRCTCRDVGGFGDLKRLDTVGAWPRQPRRSRETYSRELDQALVNRPKRSTHLPRVCVPSS